MNIPNEIYAQIFKYLNPRDIRQCLLVCMDWNHLLTSSSKFKELTIVKDNIVAFKARLDKDKHYKNWIWVKELRIAKPIIPPSSFHLTHYDDSERKNYDDELLPTLTKKQFLKLISSLPNLQKIIISSSSSEECKTFYLKWLFEVNTNENLIRLEEIYDSDYYYVDKDCALHSDGLIKINYSRGHCDFYTDLYFKFHNSLTSVSIYYGPNSIIKHKYGGISKYLSHFKNLTHLSYVGEENITLYKLQTACPHLTKLHFELVRSFPMYEIGANGFYYHHGLRELILSVPYITASFTNVITEQLPASVQELRIYMYDVDMYSWVKKIVGLERTLKLVNRMSKINRVKFDCIGDKEYKDEIFMTTFFKILNTLKDGRKFNCTGYFKESETAHQHIRVTETYLDFMYGLKYQEFAGEANAAGLDLISPTSESVLIGGPEIMNKVEFCVSPRNEAPEHYYKLLSYFLNNCPNLQHLKCYGDFSGLELCPTVAVFCGKKFEFSNPPRKNLEVVKLKNLIPSRDFLNLLRFHLPNVNYMIFKYSFKIVKFGKIEPPKDIIVDLRNFGNLEMICFDVRLLRSCMNMCNIVFEYLDGEVQYYVCTAYPMKLVSIPVNYRKLYDTYTITFKCEKIRRFVLHNGCDDSERGKDRDDFVEINYGGRPKNPLSELQYQPPRHNLRYSLYYSPFI
ncbi:hypothetical protein BD770DRAFT_412964 [Pilaira anomala]|nr:hypothetical protein BD770DRAFT_412964 [Pilaira anomala]